MRARPERVEGRGPNRSAGNGIIPKGSNIDRFHECKSVRPGRRGAKRDARASRKRRNQPARPVCASEGRALFVAGGLPSPKRSSGFARKGGARGYSKDLPLEWMYRYARQARLVDGASEVHKMVLARRLMDEGTDFWSWG